ncbi:protein FAM124B [Monodelphis domestica]|uniref:Family with sequence similarity 124 member B n=1 Tax=Monodelphis domestica TaxID=13616 RepID=F6UH70_MONDO|nr:protein FAM124B [Monodelphis domestica]XP_056664174.1 protein FAM124B [Monodelphis domestica]XP_056664175.1 protein FAM124B [Monodelphis domestica]XP_056664176.1 protein FAM124B [Monodelphis domestica]
MDERQDPLIMTVHLLANSGYALPLQQTLDHLLEWICPEVHLFLVSERVTPVKYYEKYHSKRSRFPGISVLLFLHEDLGEDRFFHIYDSFQKPPWQSHPTDNAGGRLCPYTLTNQDFYSLDPHMPVWGMRQVHHGSEILRVTLYCSFDNYEDAIRLYEMILQKEATTHKSNFSFFVLYSKKNFSIQLSLKQLPLGMSVELRESSVLQFRVQEIGQLVPLLPNPCVPISSTRWQTQDYDGNKILLQVQTNPEQDEKKGELFSNPNHTGVDNLLQDCTQTLISAKRTLDQPSRRSQTRKPKHNSPETPDLGARTLSSESPHRASWTRSSSSHSNNPSVALQRSQPSPHLEQEARIKILSQGNDFQKPEAETNVDTGFTVINSEQRRSSLRTFPRDLQSSLPATRMPNSSLAVTGSRNMASEERIHSSPFPGHRDSKGAGQTTSAVCLSQIPHGKEEEEFFI